MATELEMLMNRHHGEFAALQGMDGSSLLVLPRGGRLLGLVPGKTDAPLPFWTPATAASRDHWNVGGDRTWISPELEYFVDSEGQYSVPGSLDPGNWTLESHSTEEIRLGMDGVLRHRTSAIPIKFQIKKRFTYAPNPLLQNGSTVSLADPAVSYAGCETTTELSLEPLGNADHRTEAEGNGYCNLWSILQLPSDGEALIPTFGGAQPLIMFADSPPETLGISPYGMRIPCGGSSKFKLSFDAIASTGRLGYIRRLSEDVSTLIIRQFAVQSAGIYPDYPPDQPSYRGSCVQVFNDGGQFGNFAELEYHAPALPIWKPGQTSDHSTLFYFSGPPSSIKRIAEHMLGMPVT
ncbi:DUF6786 family protein [Paenibacillus sp. strain BS8-2]